MNILDGIRYRSKSKKVEASAAILSDTAALGAVKIVTSIGEAITNKEQIRERQLIDAAMGKLTRQARLINTKDTVDNKELTKAEEAVRKGLAKLVFTGVKKAILYVARFISKGLSTAVRMAAGMLSFLGRSIIKGTVSLARGVLFGLGRGLLLTPAGLAITGAAVVGFAAYKGYKYYMEQKREREGDWEGKETKVIPSTSAVSEVAISEKQSKVRGIRNNNPGNLEYKGQPGASAEVLPDGRKSRFARYSTQAEGLYGMASQLQRNIAGLNKNATGPDGKPAGKMNTLSKLMYSYAPPNENDTNRYIAFVAKETGLGPQDIIDARDPKVMAALMRAMIIKENGSCPYSAAQLTEAVTRSIGYADRGFRDLAGELPKIEKAIELPEDPKPVKKIEEVRVEPAQPPALPTVTAKKKQEESSVEKARKAVGNFIIPMSGRFSSGSSDEGEERTVQGRTRAHRGIDIAGPVGTTIYASHTGVVMNRSEMSGYGNTIIIKGDDGYYTWYAHMSGFRVKVGDRVRQGDPIGFSGGAPGAPGAGTSTGPHLHFGISTNVSGANSNFIQPETVLALPKEKERVRLLNQGQRVQVTSPGEAIPRVTEQTELVRERNKLTKFKG